MNYKRIINIIVVSILLAGCSSSKQNDLMAMNRLAKQHAQTINDAKHVAMKEGVEIVEAYAIGPTVVVTLQGNDLDGLKSWIRPTFCQQPKIKPLLEQGLQYVFRDQNGEEYLVDKTSC
ncbi:hypothetical protein PBPRA1279 [Photobacterium profundum SS9]|uniref:Lipoprotein n=2 Tax=Vibrionaceae TaxID=641 RepID=Q6LSN6_PHOPR|nr:hypothetical protein PBPRA1279 [Photobacterium profundum SS9]